MLDIGLFFESKWAVLPPEGERERSFELISTNYEQGRYGKSYLKLSTFRPKLNFEVIFAVSLLVSHPIIFKRPSAFTYHG